MKPFLRALFMMSVLHVGIGAGSALAQSVDAKEPATKKADETKKAPDAKTPDVTYKSNEIYKSSSGLLGKKFAVGGYDAVAYHKESKPVPGTDEFAHAWKGATWRFSSKENLEAFVKEPEKYAPQYGGYCAFAVGHGSLASGDPKIWKIVDGKLYLNLSKSVQTSWEKDIPGLIKRGDTNWPKLLK